MELELIKELMDKFSESNIYKMNIELEDFKLKLEKEGHQVVQQVVAPTPTMMSAPVQEVPKVVEEVKSQEEVAGEPVKAPLVGVFYAKSSPEAKPFVEVGQHVNAGDTLCIIEAMKVMNEIKAPISGVVTSILVEDAQLVEYEQVIMTIQG